MNSLVKRDSTQSLSSLFRQMMDRPFPNWFGDYDGMKLFNMDLFDEDSSATNIYETETEYVIEYNKAGIPEEKWDIGIENDTIYIKAENTVENEEKDEKKKYYKRTYQNIKINEQYQIPGNVETEKIEANYKDGVLKICLPKNPESPPKDVTKVKIKS